MEENDKINVLSNEEINGMILFVIAMIWYAYIISYPFVIQHNFLFIIGSIKITNNHNNKIEQHKTRGKIL